MKLRNMGSNRTILSTGEKEIFFSYNTPVAAFIPGRGYVRTNKKFSVTTSKHINQYLSGRQAETVDQSFLETLAGE